MVAEPRGLWAEKSRVLILLLFCAFIVVDIQIKNTNIISRINSGIRAVEIFFFKVVIESLCLKKIIYSSRSVLLPFCFLKNFGFFQTGLVFLMFFEYFFCI